jgi:hypothetical protein
MKIFKSNWSKWQPITIYIYEYQDRLILGKINVKTGDIQFKSIKFHGKRQYHQAWSLFKEPLNANENLQKLFSTNCL